MESPSLYVQVSGQAQISPIPLTMLKEEPRLSGAFIRSLVKRLCASRQREPTLSLYGVGSSSSHGRIGEEAYGHGGPPPGAPPRPRKQVRRRLHTARPFQQRLLDMAEARREIVAALKLHRAAMKRTGDVQQQHGLPQLPSSPPPFAVSPKGLFTATPSAPSPSSSPSAPVSESVDIHLQDPISPAIHATLCAPAPPPSNPRSPLKAAAAPPPPPAAVLHPAMSEEEMAEIRSIAEQHDVEWSDRLSMTESAWWSSFLEETTGSGEGVCPPPLEDLLEIHEWGSNRPCLVNYGLPCQPHLSRSRGSTAFTLSMVDRDRSQS
ncbi:unnamed protein product [Spirodela intermedia]|uniref:Uncharacterized protein n=1 Tax=Spirodela intermedia TaxID=51605 RepID=A0A7I8KVU6_SPIIN|nr:unnamed protein product [Spirodela intermedia]